MHVAGPRRPGGTGSIEGAHDACPRSPRGESGPASMMIARTRRRRDGRRYGRPGDGAQQTGRDLAQQRIARSGARGLSLTSLKSSRSSDSTATGRPSRCAAPWPGPRRSVNSSRFAQPGERIPERLHRRPLPAAAGSRPGTGELADQGGDHQDRRRRQHRAAAGVGPQVCDGGGDGERHGRDRAATGWSYGSGR